MVIKVTRFFFGGGDRPLPWSALAVHNREGIPLLRHVVTLSIRWAACLLPTNLYMKLVKLACPLLDYLFLVVL